MEECWFVHNRVVGPFEFGNQFRFVDSALHLEIRTTVENRECSMHKSQEFVCHFECSASSLVGVVGATTATSPTSVSYAAVDDSTKQRDSKGSKCR